MGRGSPISPGFASSPLPYFCPSPSLTSHPSQICRTIYIDYLAGTDQGKNHIIVGLVVFIGDLKHMLKSLELRYLF